MKNGGFGKFDHTREPAPLDKQTVDALRQLARSFRNPALALVDWIVSRGLHQGVTVRRFQTSTGGGAVRCCSGNCRQLSMRKHAFQRASASRRRAAE